MSEDDRAVRILRTLPDEPPAPSTVDVARTMAEGRRRRRARRWSGGVALAAVTAVAAGGGTVAVSAMRTEPAPVPRPAASTAASTAVAAPVPLPRNCQVTLLPSRGIRKALVTAGDPSGRYLAGRIYPGDGPSQTVIWKDGKLLPAVSMEGADASWEDINSSGLAVGTSFDGDQQQAFTIAPPFSVDAVTRLPGGRAVAAAVNDAGVIVGQLGDPFTDGVPARWASPTAGAEKLPLPAGYPRGAAKAIDEDGTVAGLVSRGRERLGTGYLWQPDGTGRLIPRPDAGGEKADFFWPESISDGVVYGRAGRDSADGSSREFASYAYTIATGAFRKLPVDLGPPALGATNGRVLGVRGISDVVVVAGDQVVKLPRYHGMKEYVVSAFSADGKVAAGYTTDTDETEGVANRPVRWNCGG
ncbi:hypothetical protein [Paractinoplanes abujensis]|uniref:Putative membrane protein n=1 Tax=Paractinoplanes abujensis TaxID=882441 RepID=A0A7W7CQW7_9ACTN|nr:hypothetical protein [Actinoplanes abujensis]MBB4691266.1 putative membrane protein [Actinoplanes abujensis]